MTICSRGKAIYFQIARRSDGQHRAAAHPDGFGHCRRADGRVVGHVWYGYIIVGCRDAGGIPVAGCVPVSRCRARPRARGGRDQCVGLVNEERRVIFQPDAYGIGLPVGITCGTKTTGDVERIGCHVCKSGRTSKSIARNDGVFQPGGVAVVVASKVNTQTALCGRGADGLRGRDRCRESSRAEAFDDDLAAGVVGTCGVVLVGAEIVGAAAAAA